MKYRVLLVEDDEIDIMTVQRALDRARLVVDFHAEQDGASALEYLSQNINSGLPIIVFLDINMPKMNGIEFLAALRGNPDLRKTPVLMLTSSKRDQDVCDAFAYQIAGYLVKPLNMEDLVEMIKVVLRYWEYSEMVPDVCRKGFGA